jgi:hypothetical protein
LLLALPDPCLVAVLHCCAVADHHSLFSAARAHSRLHQAAVLALRSITTVVREQQQMDDVVLYLSKHSHSVNSIKLAGPEAASMAMDYDKFQVQLHAPSLQQLPPNLQLDSLQLECLCLQLQPGAGFQGVLGGLAVAALKQLSIKGCKVLDNHFQMTEAFAQLPTGLEQLSIDYVSAPMSRCMPTAFLQQLQQLTYLEIAGVSVHGTGNGSPAWQPLQELTRLVDLRVNCYNGKLSEAELVTASMLSSMQRLTRLELCGIENRWISLWMEIEPGALAGKAQLQHIALHRWIPCGGKSGVTQLLHQLAHMQQLTYLSLVDSLPAYRDLPATAAVAFEALTTSSKLQYLNISSCELPAGAWQLVFPVDKQLPALQQFNISSVRQHDTSTGWYQPARAPDGSRLVACCPALQSLDVRRLKENAKLLVPLPGLSGLHTLHLDASLDRGLEGKGLEAVCHLTGLRKLELHVPDDTQEGLLLQLAQLKQLTALTYVSEDVYACKTTCLIAKVSMVKWRPKNIFWRHVACEFSPHTACIYQVLVVFACCVARCR